MQVLCKNFYLQSHNNPDLKSISCCLYQLISTYEMAKINLNIHQFSFFLTRTINHYFKNSNKKFINENLLTLNLLSHFIEIISEISSYFFFYNNSSNNIHNIKDDYIKILISFTIEIINNSQYKNEKEIISRKNALINNISCLYFKEKRFDKSLLFLDKCIEMNKNKIDNAISYNNYAILQHKKNNLKLTTYYFHLMYKEIKDLIKEKNKKNNIDEINNNKLIIFLMFNYCKFNKKYNQKDFNEQIDKLCDLAKKNFGNKNFLTIEFLRLRGDDLNSYFHSILLNDDMTTLDSNNNSEEEFFTSNNTQNNKKKTFRKRAESIVSDFNNISYNSISKEDISPKSFYYNNNNNNANNYNSSENNSVNRKNSGMNLQNNFQEKLNQNEIHKNRNSNKIFNNKNNSNKNIFLNINSNEKKVLFNDSNIQNPNRNNSFDIPKIKINTPKSNSLKKSITIKNDQNFLFHNPQQSNLPFKKKKMTLKDAFSLAINMNKPKKKSMDFFSLLLKRNSQNNSMNLSLSNGFNNLSPIKNKYNDLMSEVENQKKDFSLVTTLKNAIIKKSSIINSNNESIVEDNNNNHVLLHRNSKSIFNNDEKKTNKFFMHLLTQKNEMNDYPNYVQNIIDFNVLDDMNNLYKNKNENYISLIKEIKRITDEKVEKKNFLELYFNNNNNIYLIGMKSDFEKKIINAFILDPNNNNKELYSINFSYEKLAFYVNKISYDNTLPLYTDLTFIRNSNHLINKILIKHLNIIFDSNNNFQIGLNTYQKGIFEKDFEITFLKCSCLLNFFVNKSRISFIIVNKSNENEFLRFEISLDEGVNKILFKKKTYFDNKYEHITINKDYDYLKLFKDIFVKIHEIIKLNNKEMTFSEYVKNANLYFIIHKIVLENKLNKKEFWIINQEPVDSDEKKFKWKVNYYSLNKIEIANNNSYYIHKEIILNSEDFTHIIGIEPKNINDLMSDKDKFITNYILLHTIKMRNIMTKILTEHNYDSMLKLIKINPSCFFRFKFVFNHIKKYFGTAFEFLVFNKECFFLRLMITEILTSRSYTKIYLPFDMYKKENNENILKKKLEEKFNSKKTLINDKKKLREIVYNETLKILAKNKEFVLYENIDNILEKINGI